MDSSAGLRTLTRIGFAGRGLLYLTIAYLLIRAGRPEDPSGALEYIAEGTGRLLLMVITAGFIAYGIWRLSDSFFNIERHPPNAKGLRERLGAAGSGIVHLLLAWQAIRLLRGAVSVGSGGPQDEARTALSLPGGEWALAVAGAVLIGVGFFQLIKAVKAKFLRHLEPQVASEPWAKWTGRFGYAARGLVFLISGYFLLQAGLSEQPGNAGGMQEALAWLDRPWDQLVAAGLFCFGLFSLVEARFRIIHDVPVDEIAHGAIRPSLH